MRESLKPSTRKTYASVQLQFLVFCNKNRLKPLPAKESVIMMFISYLYEKGLKGSTIRCYMSALKHLHVINKKIQPSYSPQVSAAISGSMSLSSGPTRKKPITFSILCDMIKYLGNRSDSLMLKVAMTTLFFGCLRSGELTVPDGELFNEKLNVSREDVSFDLDREFFRLFLKKSKTDKYSQGVTVLIGCSKHSVCAFCLMREYVRINNWEKPSDPLLVHHGGIPLSRSYLVNNTKILVGFLGYNPGDFSGHSYRAGSATSAGTADNAFKDWEMKLLGRWKSNVFNIYLRKPELVSKFAKRLANYN